MRKKPWRRAGLLAAPFLCLALRLGASGPAQAAGGPRFHVDAWGTRDGLIANEVIAITQTRSGYLWLGTLYGLVRFDGVQFKVFDEHNTPGLASGQIVYLFEDSKSNLWIGTQTAGALLLQSNQITDLGFGKGGREGGLRAASEDATGAVWLLTADGRLARFRDGKLAEFGNPQAQSQGTLVERYTLVAETNGMLFLGADELDPTAVRESVAPAMTRVSGMSMVDFLLASRTGGRWCMGQDGIEKMLEKWDGDRLVLNLGPYPWDKKQIITAACEDLDGNLIVGTQGAGVWWFDQNGKVTQICETNGLSGNVVRALQMDDEGGLWVGLDPGGLNRVQRQRFQPLEASINLTIHSVADDASGRLWFSSSTHGVEFRTNEIVANAVSRPGPISQFDARAILVDREQNIWAATLSAGLFRWETDRFQPAPGHDQINNAIYALYQDRAGKVWAGTARGLAGWDGHAWRVYAADDGLSANIVRAVADDATGNLWIGTEGRGLFCLRDGKINVVQPDNGFPSKNISALYADKDGVLWVGTSGNGLIRLRHNHCVNYTTDNGLSGNGVAYILEDDQEFLWLGSNAGLMRVKKSDLNAFAGGSLDYVPCHSYGERAGLPSDECTPGSQPAACVGTDGTLWFPTIAGLVGLPRTDLSHVEAHSNAVPVLIESVLVDGEEQGAAGPGARAPLAVVIPPGKELLEIHYAGLNFADPKQLRFQYFMEDYDKRPRDAGGARVASYIKLPPGQYRFQVRARNEDGLWNPVAATLAVSVLPAYWQTKSFQGLIGAGLLAGLMALVYYISTQRLQRQVAGLRQQQALEKDRARIARDIHDQVGASLTQLSLLGEMVGSDKNDPAEVEAHAGQITQTARETAHALDEIVWTVNPSNDTLEGLINYICKHAQEYLAVAGLRYRIEAPAQLPAAEISPEARHNVFLAAKESVTNIVKHAHATEACIRLRLEPKSFTLEIEDDGRGPGGLTSAAAQSRNGMRNMRKRMEDIGGKFEIGPGAKGGTLVRLIAPLN